MKFCLTKQTFLEIQAGVWDASPSYPNELPKSEWIECCAEFYDENPGLFVINL